MKRQRSLADLAKEAYEVQDACNLSGVLLGAHEACSELLSHTSSTEEAANHPIMRLWVDKIVSLAGLSLNKESDDKVMDAYSHVRALMESRR